MIAPIASNKIPSASSIVLTPWCTLIRFNKGVITVGPVTMISVPNNIEVLKSQPKKIIVIKVPPMRVHNAPMVIKPRMAFLSRIILLIRRFIPPSKRMIATAKPTRICSPGPSESGLIQFSPSGPNNIPDNNNSTMPGR